MVPPRVLVQRPDGAVVADARVEITGNRFPRETRAANSGIDGTVLFENLPEGHYVIVARAGDQLSGRASFVLTQEDVLADRVVGASVSLRGAGIVRGVFLSADTREPIANAEVSLSVVGVSSVRGLGNVGAITVTDADGYFEYLDVPVGDFNVIGVDPTNLRSGAVAGTLFDQNEIVEVTVVTRSLGSVEGVVLAANGVDPIPGASISINPAQLPIGTPQFPRVTASADGRFSFDGVPEGAFQLTAHDPVSGYIGLARAEIQSEGEQRFVEVRIAPYGSITGVVYEADGVSPARNAQVRRPVIGGRASSTQGTDENGRYRLSRMPLGTFELAAVALSTNNLLTQDGGVAVAELSEADQVVEADIFLNGTGFVEVTVLDANGAPVPTADVRLMPHSEFGEPINLFTEADGTVVFDGVAVGRFDVRAESSTLRVGGAVSAEISAHQEQVGVTVQLGASGSVFGRLVLPDIDATPVPQARVTLRFDSQTQFGGVLQGFTDELGHYRFDNVPVGAFVLEFDDMFSDGIALIQGRVSNNEQQVDMEAVLLDLEAPRVVASVPAEGAQSVAVDANISLQFSEPIDPSSVIFDNSVSTPNLSGNVLLVDGAGAKLAADVAVSADGLTLSVDPRDEFASEGRYRLSVARGENAIRDAAAGRSLQSPYVLDFVARDSKAPQLLSVAPAAGARGVAANSVLRFTFDEPVNSDASLEVSRGGVPISGSVSRLIADTVLVFTPDEPLELNSRYVYTLDQVSDIAGNPLIGAPLSGDFETLDTRGPEISTIAAPLGPRIGGSQFEVEALTSAGDVAKVEFTIDGVPAGSTANLPYVLNVQTPLKGSAIEIGAIATDISGNRGPPTSISLPIVANEVPQIELLNSGGATGAGRGQTLELQVLASDDLELERVVVSVTGAFSSFVELPLGSRQNTLDTIVQIPVPATAPSGGAIALQAAAFDSTGFNASSNIIDLPMVDGVPPSVQFTTPVNGAQVRAGQPLRVTLAAKDDAELESVTLSCSPQLAGCGTRLVNDRMGILTFMLTLPANLIAPTRIDLSAAARDSAGNISPLAARQVQIADTVAPAQASLVTSSGLTRVLQNEVVILRANVSDNLAVAEVRFNLSGAIVRADVVAITGAPSSAIAELAIPIPDNLVDGAIIDVSALAVDTSGNVGEQGTLQLRVGDVVPPTTAILAPAPNVAYDPGSTIELQVQADDDVAITELAYSIVGAFDASGTIDIDPPQRSVTRTISIAVPVGTTAGEISISVLAFDGRNFAPTQTLLGSVRDTELPVVSIIEPIDGATIDPRNPLAVMIQAVDNIAVREISVSASGVLTQTQTQEIRPPAANVTRTLDLGFASLPATGGTISLDAQAIDEAGNIGFASSIVLNVQDVVAPVVTALDPADGSLDVDPAAPIRIDFSEPMAAATVNASAITLSIGGDTIAASVELSEAQTVVVIPSEAMPPRATVQLEVATSVSDLVGNRLGAPFVSTFQVANDDVQGPQVLSLTPADGALGISAATAITVSFDEAVDAATITGSSFRVLIASTSVAGRVDVLDADSKIRFTPDQLLPFDTEVVVELTNEIRDVFGNALRDASGQPLTVPLSFTFRTGAFAMTNPADGDTVSENSMLVLQSAASAALAVADVVYAVNGDELAPALAPNFIAMYDVPSADLVSQLDVVATARDSSGNVVTTDRVVVDRRPRS